MSVLSLSVKLRTEQDRNPRTLRDQGLIPGVLYGPEIENLCLLIKEADFLCFLKTAPKNKPFVLKIEGENKEIKNILLHELQEDSLKDRILSIDFYQFSAKKKIKVPLEIELIGKAPAQDLGGVVVQSMNEVEVECLPTNIPEKLVVDISCLEDFDSTIHIRDLKFPEGVVCNLDLQTPVVSITEPVKEVVEEPVLAGTEELETGEKAVEPGTDEQRQAESESAE
jgi:large subunit ribosomal protein L25